MISFRALRLCQTSTDIGGHTSFINCYQDFISESCAIGISDRVMRSAAVAATLLPKTIRSSTLEHILFITSDINVPSTIVGLEGASCIYITKNSSLTLQLQRLAKEKGVFHKIYWLIPSQKYFEGNALDEQKTELLNGYQLFQYLMNSGYENVNLELNLVTRSALPLLLGDRVEPASASMHELFNVLARKFSTWDVNLFDVESVAQVVELDLFNKRSQRITDTLYVRSGLPYQARLVESVDGIKKQGGSSVIKKDGVYVIIGGANGLGSELTSYILQHYQAKVIWLDKSPMNVDTREKVNRVSGATTPTYLQTDISDISSLKEAYDTISHRFGVINGLINASSVLDDQKMISMTESQLCSIVDSKQAISKNISTVFSQEPLDFVLFLSAFNSINCSATQTRDISASLINDNFANALAGPWTGNTVKVVQWEFMSEVEINSIDQFYAWMSSQEIDSIKLEQVFELVVDFLASPLQRLILLNDNDQLTFRNSTQDLKLDSFPNSTFGTDANLLIPALERNKLREATQDPVQPLTDIDDAEMVRLLWLQLTKLGALVQGGLIDDLLNQNTITETGQRWIYQAFRILNDKGFLLIEDGYYSLTAVQINTPEDSLQRWNKIKQQWVDNPAIGPKVTVLDTVLPAIPEVVRGERNAIEVMFPFGSLELVSRIYRDNPIADGFNAMVAEIAKNLLISTNSRVSILEVGAGTGSTCEQILHATGSVANRIQEYCYTDISEYFLRHARLSYQSKYPFVRPLRFDAERPAVAQGIEAGSYDLVIAVNVLHATKDIRATLRNVKSLLKSGGVLVLNELANTNVFSHLTFGLLDGWWRYDDTIRLPGCPGLSAKAWCNVLQQEGFYDVTLPTGEFEHLGSQIIAARSNGLNLMENTVDQEQNSLC